MYGADMRDCEKIADYLIEHYEVKHLVLNVYLDNGFTYDDETDRLTRNLHYLTDRGDLELVMAEDQLRYRRVNRRRERLTLPPTGRFR